MKYEKKYGSTEGRSEVQHGMASMHGSSKGSTEARQKEWKYGKMFERKFTWKFGWKFIRKDERKEGSLEIRKERKFI